MELFDTKITILKWIRSCDKVGQLELLTKFIGTIVYPQFSKEIEDKKGNDDKNVLKYELAEAILELTNEVTDRTNILATTPERKPIEYPKDAYRSDENKLNELT